MSRQSRTKLVPPKTEPERNQVLETLEESSLPEQKEEPAIIELDNEIECPLRLVIQFYLRQFFEVRRVCVCYA